jgi:hypothetical protein
VWSAPWPGLLTPRKDQVSIVKEAGWVPGLFCMGAENVSTGIGSLDHPACSKSLYQVRYPSLQYDNNAYIQSMYRINNYQNVIISTDVCTVIFLVMVSVNRVGEWDADPLCKV